MNVAIVKIEPSFGYVDALVETLLKYPQQHSEMVQGNIVAVRLLTIRVFGD